MKHPFLAMARTSFLLLVLAGVPLTSFVGGTTILGNEGTNVAEELAAGENIEATVVGGQQESMSSLVACGTPTAPYDDDVQTVPSGSSYCGPDYGCTGYSSEAAARGAVAKGIGNSHDPYRCGFCTLYSQCVKEVLTHPQDDAWHYEYITCMDGEGIHIELAYACLQEGGHYVRTCKPCP